MNRDSRFLILRNRATSRKNVRGVLARARLQCEGEKLFDRPAGRGGCSLATDNITARARSFENVKFTKEEDMERKEERATVQVASLYSRFSFHPHSALRSPSLFPQRLPEKSVLSIIYGEVWFFRRKSDSAGGRAH